MVPVMSHFVQDSGVHIIKNGSREYQNLMRK